MKQLRREGKREKQKEEGRVGGRKIFGNNERVEEVSSKVVDKEERRVVWEDEKFNRKKVYSKERVEERRRQIF